MDHYTAVTHAIEIAKSAVSGFNKYLDEAYAEGVVEFIKTVAAGLENMDEAESENAKDDGVSPEVWEDVQDEEAKVMTEWPPNI